jgi:DNA mismatch endonuclease Vsr
MADRITADVRSRNMAAIRGKDTTPEMVVRRFLHAHGFRYRLHDRKLPGRPDVVLPKHHAVVEIRGCFWHMHGCKNTVIPKTRSDWWREKLEGNRARDERNRLRLEELGWKVIIVWECEISQAHLEDLPKRILQQP